MGEAPCKLLAQIVQPIEILERMAHPVFGLAPAFLVLRDPRRFLEKVAQVVRLKVNLPGVEKPVAEEVVAGAHERCPYSNATRGNIDVKLTVV